MTEGPDRALSVAEEFELGGEERGGGETAKASRINWLAGPF